MAKSVKKNARRPKKNKWGVVMTDRLRLFLIACFLIGFIAIGVMILR